MANKQWRLASYPEGMPTPSTWTLGESPMPAAGANEMLARAIYLDVAPYMRGRISPQKNYAARHPEARARIGDWIRGGLLKSKFDIAKGIESMPQAFLRLLESRNLGKQIVQVGDEPQRPESCHLP